MNMDNLKRADIAFILKKKKSVSQSQKFSNQIKKIACQYYIKSEQTCESALTTCCGFSKLPFLEILPRAIALLYNLKPPQRAHTHTHSMYSQEGWGAKPGRDRLYALPFLLINEAQEVIFRSGSLIPPKHTIFTAATHAQTAMFNHL